MMKLKLLAYLSTLLWLPDHTRSLNTVRLEIIVGWVSLSLYPTKLGKCWVSFLNPTYAELGF
ncbi:hypothetical protein LC593_17465 [Nostoc sp. CHAB 5844]|nr:hypothetical protein [Nostoc sp. CHAB 5844]